MIVFLTNIADCCGVVQGQANSQGLVWAWRDASCMRTQAVSFLDSSSSVFSILSGNAE
jgi:hypothetical protein